MGTLFSTIPSQVYKTHLYCLLNPYGHLSCDPCVNAWDRYISKSILYSINQKKAGGKTKLQSNLHEMTLKLLKTNYVDAQDKNLKELTPNSGKQKDSC